MPEGMGVGKGSLDSSGSEKCDLVYNPDMLCWLCHWFLSTSIIDHMHVSTGMDPNCAVKCMHDLIGN